MAQRAAIPSISLWVSSAVPGAPQSTPAVYSSSTWLERLAGGGSGRADGKERVTQLSPETPGSGDPCMAGELLSPVPLLFQMWHFRGIHRAWGGSVPEALAWGVDSEKRPLHPHLHSNTC